MDKRIKATSRVQITVEMTSGSWGGDCNIEQLYKQSAEEASNRLLRRIRGQDIATPPFNDMKIIGGPKVFGIVTEELE